MVKKEEQAIGAHVLLLPWVNIDKQRNCTEAYSSSFFVPAEDDFLAPSFMPMPLPIDLVYTYRGRHNFVVQTEF